MEYTLYHSDHTFIGRTCASMTGQLTQREGKYEAKMDDYAIFLLSFAPERVQVLVELIVYEVDDVGRRLHTTIASIGWGIIPVKASSDTLSIPLYAGSPRLSLGQPASSIRCVLIRYREN